jgi:hypothetical protein
MSGTRIAPDDNDIVVWRLDEAGAPFVNSSTSPSAPSHAISDLSTLSGTILLQQPSLFAASGANSCIMFTGANSSSPRNFISGANSVMPQAPVSFSCWVYLRAYNTTGFTQHLWVKQTNTGNWSSTFASVELQNRTYAGQSQQWDLFVLPTSGGTPLVSAESTVPLHAWTHTAVTWDGTTQIAYINGNVVATATSTGPINYGSTPGPWFFGAIPSGSGNPEEPVVSICDFRIANIVRPQSYFQNIYRNGVLSPGTGTSPLTRYYKLRAYDTNCATSNPVYWISTGINYNGAPPAPCGGNLGPIEIVGSWTKLGF